MGMLERERDIEDMIENSPSETQKVSMLTKGIRVLFLYILIIFTEDILHCILFKSSFSNLSILIYVKRYNVKRYLLEMLQMVLIGSSLS